MHKHRRRVLGVVVVVVAVVGAALTACGSRTGSDEGALDVAQRFAGIWLVSGPEPLRYPMATFIKLSANGSTEVACSYSIGLGCFRAAADPTNSLRVGQATCYLGRMPDGQRPFSNEPGWANRGQRTLVLGGNCVDARQRAFEFYFPADRSRNATPGTRAELRRIDDAPLTQLQRPLRSWSFKRCATNTLDDLVSC